MEPCTSVNGGEEEELPPTGEPLETKATYRCPLCPKRFIPRSLSEVSRLRCHLITDHNVLNDSKDTCPICGAIYQKSWYLEKHVEDVHFQPPRPKGLKGLPVWCRFCFKDISKNYIKAHIRAHYKMPSLPFSVNSQQRLDKPAQGRKNNRGRKPNQRQCETGEICSPNYSIYDLLGTIGKHYQAIRGTYDPVIELYPTVPSDEDSKDVKLNDAVYKSPPLHDDDNVIILDSDSDDSEHCDLVYGAQNGELTRDSDAMLSEDDNARSEFNTIISANSGLTQIRIENVTSIPATSESKHERRDEHLVETSADVVDINVDVADKSVDVADISVDVADISADERKFCVGENLDADEGDVCVGEVDMSADEEDIVAELEQYIEDNELMEELNSANS